MTVAAMSDIDRRHRVVAVGSGFVRLTATKALKHSLADIADALVFLTRITARGTAQLHTQWLQVLPTTAAAVAGVGVLIALCAAIVCARISRSSVALQAGETVGSVGVLSHHRYGWRSQQIEKGCH